MGLESVNRCEVGLVIAGRKKVTDDYWKTIAWVVVARIMVKVDNGTKGGIYFTQR